MKGYLVLLKRYNKRTKKGREICEIVIQQKLILKLKNGKQKD